MSQINLKEQLLLKLLKDYEEGQIGLKAIANLLGMSLDEILNHIISNDIECPITPEIDEYTKKITDNIIQRLNLEKDFQK